MADRRITRAADSLEISVICNPHAVIYGECETKHLIISQELIIWTAWISASFPSAVSDPFFYKWLRRGIVCAPGGGRGWALRGGRGWRLLDDWVTQCYANMYFIVIVMSDVRLPTAHEHLLLKGGN